MQRTLSSRPEKFQVCLRHLVMLYHHTCAKLSFPLPRLYSSQPKGYFSTKNAHILTYSMVQSPSWETNWFAASQEISRILRNPKVHYRTHKRPPPICILGQPNPVYIPTSYLLEIHPNIIHPSESLYFDYPVLKKTPLSLSSGRDARRHLYAVCVWEREREKKEKERKNEQFDLFPTKCYTESYEKPVPHSGVIIRVTISNKFHITISLILNDYNAILILMLQVTVLYAYSTITPLPPTPYSSCMALVIATPSR